ncbi:MAG: Glycoside hydrolase family 42 domain protein [Thermotoga sp. 50_1627]|nr:MAG: Glycoside hydrolase family 42 domain protein [Thermotoga sp. 50_1627]
MNLKNFFPVSVWYGPHRSRAPMVAKIRSIQEVEKDIITIKSLGFNSIRFWYDWATAEPKPDEWDFSTIDTLLSIVDKLQIKAIVQVYTDSAPNWVERDYPDSLFVDRSGLVIHSQASPGYCSDHPQVRKHIETFLQKLAEVVASHESFYAWDIWSEPHIVQWSWIDYIKDPWFCYCKHSQKRFVEWLKKKYRTIDALNDAWYRKHASWEEVIAPRYVSLSSFRDLLDWIQFNIEKIAEDLRWKVATIKKVDGEHVVSSHAAISSVYGIPGIGYGASDDWKLSEMVDVWGTSFYPKHTGSWMPLKPHHMGVALDASRSSCESRGKPFWIGELQTGHGVTGMRFGEPVDEKDVERWAWLAVSRNAKGLNYYAWLPMSCGYEVSGFGLAEYDGSINERAISAGRVAKTITEKMEIFASAKPLAAEVAILYNIESHKALACLRAESAELIRKDMFGMYRAMMDMGVNVDFLHIGDLHSDLSKYKLILIPFSIALDEKSAEAIKKYVANGGTILADGRIAWMKEDGSLCEKIPGLGLHELFGCEELWMKELKKETNLVLKEKRLTVSACRYLSVYRVTSGTAIAFFQDKPVIVENNYFSGRAIMVGTLIGVGYEETGNTDNLELIRQLATERGVQRKYFVRVRSGDADSLEIRFSTLPSGEILVFVFNHTNSECCFDLSIPKNVFQRAFEEATCLNRTGSVAVESTPEFTVITDIAMDGGETLVFLLQ